VRTSLLATFYSLSGDAAPNERWRVRVRARQKILDSVVVRKIFRHGLTKRISIFHRRVQRTGFRGALNWYRNIESQLGTDRVSRRRESWTSRRCSLPASATR